MSDGGQKRSSSSFHFAAGLASGTFTAVLLQPVDLLKTRIQQHHGNTLRDTLRSIASSPSPVRQLWRGTLPSSIRTGLGSALYFGSLNFLRNSVAKAESIVQKGGSGIQDGTTAAKTSSSSLPKLSAVGNLATGAIARASAGFLMMPITVIKVRYESTYYAYSSLAHASTDILRKEGPRGFFAGFGATAVRDAPYAGLYVLFYESCKSRLSAFAHLSPESNRAMTTRTSASINFASGAAAAGMATALTNPFDAIKTRLQLMPHKYRNMVHAAQLMLREEGARSFMDGLALRMSRKAFSSALAWTVYEELIRRAEVRWKQGAEGVL